MQGRRQRERVIVAVCLKAQHLNVKESWIMKCTLTPILKN